MLITGCEIKSSHEKRTEEMCKTCIENNIKYLVEYNYKFIGCYRYEIFEKSTYLVFKAYNKEGELIIEEYMNPNTTRLKINNPKSYCRDILRGYK
jgi:ssDNA-binding Zn-finger/Zn-ribbon topoisomerase 1